MHRALSARWLNRTLSTGEAAACARVPLRLRPLSGACYRGTRTPLVVAPCFSRRLNHTEATTNETTPSEETNSAPEDVKPTRKLPLTCSGCGAFVQTQDSGQLGYYDLQTKRVETWLNPPPPRSPRRWRLADQLARDVLDKIDIEKLKQVGLVPSDLLGDSEEELSEVPVKPEGGLVCERCNDLKHYSTTSATAKIPVFHPTVESLRETIEESPHKYNHIYHVLDAADFPMSLVPRLNVLLGDIPLRSRNRRSRSGKFIHDRRTEMSFIITRSDLLAPTKTMVDSLMPYLREVLRDALGRVGARVRLGNVRCVSARRGWWTKEVREDIWDRGGAGWMVGKTNVGKSNLFEAVFPKGRMGDSRDASTASVSTYPQDAVKTESVAEDLDQEDDWDDVEVGQLLPPPQPAMNYPDMPLVSHLPGTTASPIRVPFGTRGGELIDLPGLERSDLALFVKPEARKTIVMRKRIVPKQNTLQPRSSLILGGGLIRITPRTDMIFLAYNFTPLTEHMTNTDKAIEFQEQRRHADSVPSIMLDGIGDKMKHAGTFTLSHDVTKRRAGLLTSKQGYRMSVDRLMFRVLSTDILIEGVGYVELVAQVRAKDYLAFLSRQEHAGGRREETTSDPFSSAFSSRRDASSELAREVVGGNEYELPSVDVFSPEGMSIGSRQPIHGWLNNQPRTLEKHKKSRPRKSMKGAKKAEKKAKREHEGNAR